jgi:hypothetical protein
MRYRPRETTVHGHARGDRHIVLFPGLRNHHLSRRYGSFLMHYYLSIPWSSNSESYFLVKTRNFWRANYMLRAYFMLILKLLRQQLLTTDTCFCEVHSGRARHLRSGPVPYGHHNSMPPVSQSHSATLHFRSKLHQLPSFRPYHGTLCILYGSQNLNRDRSSIAGGYHISRNILR